MLKSLVNRAFRIVTFSKSVSNTGVFLWNLRKLEEHLFWKKSVNDCFWNLFKFYEDCTLSLTYTSDSNWYIQKQPTEVFGRNGTLRNFTKFTEKHLRHSLFFKKVASRPVTLLKKRLWHRCFPVNFVKFLRTPFSHLLLFVPVRLEGVEKLKYRCVCRLPFGKF